MAYLISPTGDLCPIIPNAGSKFTWSELINKLWTITGRYWVYELGEELLVFNPEGYDMQHALNPMATTLAQEQFPSAEIYGIAVYVKVSELKERHSTEPYGLPTRLQTLMRPNA